MEENTGIKISHISNLPALNIKSQLNMNIDPNSTIKRVLNVEACIIECNIEPVANKAVVKGTLGIKVMYVDMDNMYNTLSDSTTFSESISSEIISSGCEINVVNSQFICEFDNDDKSIKINIDGSIDCMCNLNSGLNTFNQIGDGLVAKKSTLQANSCVQNINKTTNYDFDFTLGAKINKVLSCNSKMIVDDAKCYDGYILISGQILNTIIYETDNGGLASIKVANNSTPFKCEIEATACDGDCVADVASYINLDATQITTDIGDSETKFNFEYCIVASGYIYKTINIDIVEDLYSTNTEIETISNAHLICSKAPHFKTTENVDSEITLADELNVDEILGMANTTASVTQYSVKDEVITIEGVVSGNLLYLDENRETKQLSTQLPYSINIKQGLVGELCGIHLSVTPTACRCKIKRGNTLVVDYELNVNGCYYTKTNVELIDGIKYGKAINYGDVAFQIYVARPNESDWNLCKRLRITPEKLAEYNKENPAMYLGGEKIIVYR